MGALLLGSDGRALTYCLPERMTERHYTDGCALLDAAARELRAYFCGELRAFETPLALSGTAFEARVWEQTIKIPYGETRAYSELAAALGNPKASRAAGGALGRNRLMIFVPCHRVLGADGKLRGYAGGLDMKRALIRLEGIKLISTKLDGD